MLLGTAHMIVEVFEDGPLDGIKWQFPIKGTLIIYYLLYHMRSIYIDIYYMYNVLYIMYNIGRLPIVQAERWLQHPCTVM